MRYSFREFELDTATFELRQAGQRVELQPKVLRLLVYLIEQRERVVPSDELLRVLWPQIKVDAGSLKRAVSGARHALGERGDSESSIRTARGRGYQFASAVRMLETKGAHHPSRLLLGRESIMALLESSLDCATRGDPACLLLTGAPGIGKTRICEELWARAAERGMQVWTARCTDAEGAPPLWPFVQVLRAALRDRGDAERRALLGHGAAAIAEAIPELRALIADVPPPPAVPADAARFRLFDGFLAFLGAAAQQQPVLVGLDDLHLADSLSLQLLAFLVRHQSSERLLIAGAFRRDPARSRQPLDALLCEARARCIELGGLDRAALTRYVALATEREPQPSVIDALLEQTAGNPLLVRQRVERWQIAGSAAAVTPSCAARELGGAVERASMLRRTRRSVRRCSSRARWVMSR